MSALHKSSFVLSILLCAAGCSRGYQDTISAVPRDHPRDNVAVIHCNHRCVSITNSEGGVIAKQNEGFFDSRSIKDVEVRPGDYAIKYTKCSKTAWHHRDPREFTWNVRLEPGYHYYVKSGKEWFTGTHFCYPDLDIYYSEDGSDQPEKTEKARTVSAVRREQLANCGDAEQQYILGILYQMQTPPEDFEPVLAYKWLSLAADAHRRRDALPLLKRLRALMSPNQIAEAEQLIAEWEPAKEGCE